MSETIKVSIELADRAAQNALSSFVSNATKADKQMKSLGDSSQSAFQQISVGLSKAIGLQDIFVGNLAANIVSNAFQQITASIGMIVDEAAASEQAIQNLNIALKSSGQFSKAASDDFQEFAARLQETTIYSDEAALAASTYLLNLTNLSNEGIKKATLAAADLAATMGIDLQSATEMISKAVNGNYLAFSKVGIEIEKSGTQSGRLANILAALSEQQGKATQQANTYDGATKKNTNSQSELFEALGKVYTQSETVRNATLASAKAYQAAAKFISDNTVFIRDLGAAIGITAGIAVTAWGVYTLATSAALAATIVNVTTVISLLGVLGGTFSILGTLATAAWAAVTAPVTLIVAAIALVGTAVYQLVKNWESVKAATYNALAATIEFAASAAKLVSNKLADSLTAQANGYREQAKAIIEAKKAVEEKDKVEKEGSDRRKTEISDEEKARIESLNKYVEGLAKKNESIQENQKLELENLKLFYEEKDLLEEEGDATNYQAKIDREKQYLIAKQAILDQAFADEQSKIVSSTASEEDKTSALLQIQKKYQQDSQKNNVDFLKKQVEYEKLSDKERLENQKSTFSTIATLSSSNNSTLATIGKAAGIAQIAIDTPVAISKALASAPPPFGFALAGLVGAAMAAQAAKIAGLNFEQGGIVPGSSFTGDNVRANVNSGEMILNKSQQARLFNIADGGSFGGSNVLQEIRDLKNQFNQLLMQPLVVAVDGKELFNITRDQLASGRAY